MDISQFINAIPQFIGNSIDNNEWLGYASILVAMFLENLFPPIPSEVIMPLAGFYVNEGQLGFFQVVLSGLIGTVLGAFPWYGLGRLVNEKRLQIWIDKYGKWIGVNSKELSKSRKWFNTHGNSLVFWGRLIPGIRTLISVPAGIELMPLFPFVLWTTLGSLIWVIFLTLAGILLGESYARVGIILEPLSSSIKLILLVGLISFTIWFFIRPFLKNKSN